MHASSKASTANRRLAALRRYFSWALRQGRVQRDPCLELKAAKQPARFPHTLSEQQVEDLLRAPDTGAALGLRDRAMLETLYATGLRVSELVNLNILDVSLSEGVIRVTLGKGGKDRLVPLGAKPSAGLKRTSLSAAGIGTWQTAMRCYQPWRAMTPGVLANCEKYAQFADIHTPLSPHLAPPLPPIC